MSIFGSFLWQLRALGCIIAAALRSIPAIIGKAVSRG
jgi:hypothetical protein